MTVKALQMNDPLVLRLGAKVDMSAPKPASNPAPVDVDLTVKWVGDVLDEAVQESDMAHPACWEQLPWIAPASITEADVEALIEKMWLEASPPMFFVDPAHGVDFAAVTSFKDGQFTTRAIPSRDMYKPVPPTADEVLDFYKRKACGRVSESERVAFVARLEAELRTNVAPDAVTPYLSGDWGNGGWSNETATGVRLRMEAAERKNRAMREAVDRMQIVPGSAWRWQP